MLDSEFVLLNADTPLSSPQSITLEEATQNYSQGDAVEAVQLALAGAEYAQVNEISESALVGSVDEVDQSHSLLSVPGNTEAESVGAAEVYTSIENDIDVVHQKFAGGEKMIAVIASEDASSEQRYPLNLPEGTYLESNEDGSIDIFAHSPEFVAIPEEEKRVENEVKQILGKENISLKILIT